MKTFIRIFIVIFIMSITGFAAEKNIPVITFLVGKVQVAQDASKGYVPASAGMPLAPESMIKTGPDSFAEIESGKARYFVNEKTTVRVSDLKSSKENMSSAWGALKRAFSKARDFQTTQTYAIRGNESEEQIEWVSDKGSGTAGDDVLYKEMSGLLSSGDYEGTVKLYNNKSDSIKGSRTQFEFLAASAYFSLCRYAEAAPLFEKCTGDPGNSGIKSESLFFAGLAYQSVPDFQKAGDLFNSYIEKYPKSAFSAQARYLRGLILLRSGKQGKAESDFRSVMDGYPDDPVAKDAEAEYKKLKK